MPVHRMLCAAAIAVTLLASAGASGADKPAAKTRQCEKAERRVANEEKWEARARATIERDRKAREACATKEICERYDARIKATETRKTRHGARLAKFKAEAAKACGAS